MGQDFYTVLHPFIHSPSYLVERGLESIPAALVGHQCDAGLTQRDSQHFAFIFTPMSNLDSQVNLTPLTACFCAVGGRWSTQRTANSTYKDTGQMVDAKFKMFLRLTTTPTCCPILYHIAI